MMTNTNHAKSDTFKGMESVLSCPKCGSVGEVGMEMDNDEKRGNALIYRYYCHKCRHSTGWEKNAAKAATAWDKLCKNIRKENKDEP